MVAAKASDSSSARCADPTDTAAMWMRPRAREVIAARYPDSSSPPTRAVAGTRTPRKSTSAVHAPSCPIFLSLGPTLTPGASAGTRNTAIPVPLWSAGRVRANTMNRSASGALVMKRLVPSMIQSPPSLPAPPSRTAFVASPAGFEPAPSSVRANEAMTSPDAIRSSHSTFWASVPKFTRTCPAIPLLVPNSDLMASAV